MEKFGSHHIYRIPTISASKKRSTPFLNLLKVNTLLLETSVTPIVCVAVWISRPLLEPIECLLQMLLLWDPALRGGGPDPKSNKPRCFALLDNILNMKVKNIHSAFVSNSFVCAKATLTSNPCHHVCLESDYAHLGHDISPAALNGFRRR